MNIKQIIVNGLTLGTSGSNVTWSACTVYYDGSSYAVAGGATTAGHKFIYWTVGSGSFTEAASFTPGPTKFLIATNDGSGNYDVAWNKIAATSIQESNLAFTLLQGFQEQPLVTLSNVETNKSSGSFITKTVLNTSPANGGALLTIGLRVSAIGPGQKHAIFKIKISIDGQTAQEYRIFNNQATFDGPAVSVSSNLRLDGSNVDDLLNFYIGLGFRSNVTITTEMDNSTATVFADTFCEITVLYATKI